MFTVAHNCHGKINNLATKKITSRQKKQTHGKKEKTHGKRKNLTAERKDSRQKKKSHCKRNNLIAKEITMSSRPKRERGALGYFFCRDSCGPPYIVNLI